MRSYSTCKDYNAMAALVRALKLARGLTGVERSGPRRGLRALRIWIVDLLGPAVELAAPDRAFDATTALAHSIVSRISSTVSLGKPSMKYPIVRMPSSTARSVAPATRSSFGFFWISFWMRGDADSTARQTV